jgi:hypothetical protein
VAIGFVVARRQEEIFAAVPLVNAARSYILDGLRVIHDATVDQTHKSEDSEDSVIEKKYMHCHIYAQHQ